MSPVGGEARGRTIRQRIKTNQDLTQIKTLNSPRTTTGRPTGRNPFLPIGTALALEHKPCSLPDVDRGEKQLKKPKKGEKE